MKRCNKCNEEKPVNEFYKRTTGYLHSECKSCVKKRTSSRKHGPDRKRVLELDNKAAKIRRKRIRDEVFAAYGGYKCKCCGEKEPMFLTLDHINNDGGEFRKRELGKRTAAGYNTYAWLKRNNFPNDIQVMCMNCQHGKLMNNGTCPHNGTFND